MTIDREKLKALAEAATQGNWVAEGDDLFFNEDGYTKHLMETSEGSDICHDAEHPANLSFIAAASPDTILALLAEIERLAKFEDWFIRLDQVEQSLAASYKAERDQLKAENEALRKDALRYRWLRQASATDGEYTHGVCIDLWENGCGFEVTLEEADAAVDTAMAKEANRD